MIHIMEGKIIGESLLTPLLGSPIDFASFEPPFLGGSKEKVLHLNAFSATVRIIW